MAFIVTKSEIIIIIKIGVTTNKVIRHYTSHNEYNYTVLNLKGHASKPDKNTI